MTNENAAWFYVNAIDDLAWSEDRLRFWAADLATQPAGQISPVTLDGLATWAGKVGQAHADLISFASIAAGTSAPLRSATGRGA